ncbi:helix-turn-helix domain-containing protein [Candidatus Micrarchaeota archaeon]|nr:helix-turn-helix domain-containing protein [Candidatus Micrarchaeota archaeon]
MNTGYPKNNIENTIEKLKKEVAGEIALSSKPGSTMKKWREIFDITQTELADYLSVSPSTISDYESNRRTSPGINIIRRFINAIVDIDLAKGGKVTAQLTQEFVNEKEFFEVHEFATSFTGKELVKLLNAKVVANEELLDTKKVYGYTLINSLRVILGLPYSQYPRLYGAMSERAFIFTQVSTGRSPLVVIRVSALKPSIVILHGIKKVDELALKIAEKEMLPVLITNIDIEKMKNILNKL